MIRYGWFFLYVAIVAVFVYAIRVCSPHVDKDDDGTA